VDFNFWKAKHFALLCCVQTVPGAHSATCMVGMGLFLGEQSGQGMMLITHFHLAWMSRMVELSICSPLHCGVMLK
jgi:hypothetical protein